MDKNCGPARDFPFHENQSPKHSNCQRAGILATFYASDNRQPSQYFSSAGVFGPILSIAKIYLRASDVCQAQTSLSYVLTLLVSGYVPLWLAAIGGDDD
jgi:hypothetical protein